MEASKLLIEEKKIPVYKSDGITIIGEFVINKDVSIETSVEPEIIPLWAESGYKNFTVAGKSYYNYSVVTIYKNSNTVQGRAHVNHVGGSLPAGWLGAGAVIYNVSGYMVKLGTTAYTSSSASSIGNYIDHSASSGTFYAHGWSHVWNGSKYIETPTLVSPRQNF